MRASNYNPSSTVRIYLSGVPGCSAREPRVGKLKYRKQPYAKKRGSSASTLPVYDAFLKFGNSHDGLAELLDYKSEIAVLADIDEDDRLLTLPYRRMPKRKSMKIAAIEDEPLRKSSPTHML